MKELNLKRLRKAHLEQLLHYIDNNEREGYYYGNKQQYQKRHKEIKEYIEKKYHKLLNKTNKQEIENGY